jgi:hypothetical protein
MWRGIAKAACLLSYVACVGGCASPWVTVPTRPGVTVSLLVAEPKSDPKGIFLLFPGGPGLITIPGGRFDEVFPKQPQFFAESGFVGVVVDAPSDQQPRGFGDGRDFRISKEHTEDGKKVIEFVSQKWSKPIFLLGHSSGNVSAMHVALTLKDPRIKGIVLAAFANATVDRFEVPLEEVSYPVIFIHHRDDNCTSFQLTQERQKRFIKSPKVEFVEVVGGDRAKEVPCTPLDPGRGSSSTHVFSGKERDVVKVATDWVAGNKVPIRIGP